MAGIVYSLCALTSMFCAVQLLRGYRRSGARLLLWNGSAFVGLTLNNIALYFDFVLIPDQDLAVIRLTPAFLGVMVLLGGMIWDSAS